MASRKRKSEVKPVLSVKLEGPGIRTGRIPIPDLVRICEDVQNAINKQAEALKKKKGITRIELITSIHNGHKRKISASITKTVRDRVAKRLSRPRTAVVEVDGVLEMADFKREDYKCRIDPPIGMPVTCTF